MRTAHNLHDLLHWVGRPSLQVLIKHRPPGQTFAQDTCWSDHWRSLCWSTGLEGVRPGTLRNSRTVGRLGQTRGTPLPACHTAHVLHFWSFLHLEPNVPETKLNVSPAKASQQHSVHPPKKKVGQPQTSRHFFKPFRSISQSHHLHVLQFSINKVAIGQFSVSNKTHMFAIFAPRWASTFQHSAFQSQWTEGWGSSNCQPVHWQFLLDKLSAINLSMFAFYTTLKQEERSWQLWIKKLINMLTVKFQLAGLPCHPVLLWLHISSSTNAFSFRSTTIRSSRVHHGFMTTSEKKTVGSWNWFYLGFTWFTIDSKISTSPWLCCIFALRWNGRWKSLLFWKTSLSIMVERWNWTNTKKKKEPTGPQRRIFMKTGKII